MTVLVTGGTGYIGSHVVRLLQERGTDVVVADDVVTGLAHRLTAVPLLQLDLSEDSASWLLANFMAEHDVSAVLHFAARKQVAESVARPVWYYSQNLKSLGNVLSAMSSTRVTEIVFSSSAAVYGTTVGPAISETDRATPINPYGETKLAGEWLVSAWTEASQGSSAALRYFNVAGAGWPELADQQALNLVPMVFERIDAMRPPMIFGGDYDTVDGTCVRDYVHVLDLAEAHLAVLDSLSTVNRQRAAVYNVGTGVGTSVAAMLAEIRRVTGSTLMPDTVARRLGDPSIVVASAAKIASELGWRASRDLSSIVQSAWQGHNTQDV